MQHRSARSVVKIYTYNDRKREKKLIIICAFQMLTPPACFTLLGAVHKHIYIKIRK